MAAMDLHQAASDRRREPRLPMGAFANKYIDGRPYTVELVDASMGGVAIRRIAEPESASAESFTLEMWVDGRPIFAWARRVRSHGDREAYQIISANPLDRARIRKFLRTLAG
jgi:hypothetical protein